MTDKQKDVITKIRSGTLFYFNSVTTYHPYTVGDFGMDAKHIDGRVMNSIEKLGIIKKTATNRIVFVYELTELGKNIKL